jgi:serine/threonine-protein kinase
MANESRVQQLLDEVFDSERTPEEVCGDCPELLPEIRRRWRRMRLVEAQLEALFPSPESSTEANDPAPRLPAGDLPRIPGYEVEAVLGRGGMGIVFKAWHLRLERHVALKMLLVGACATPAERERFAREATAVAGLRHANIVQVHDVGDHEGRPYFTMEYVEGGSLAKQLSGTPQPARQAAALLATLAEAVHVAHQGGIVHRDLKPSNILLTADGTLRISDFGLARRLQDPGGLTWSGTPVGTPSYMAPEQAQGRSGAVGPAADTYALGVILYELLTGRPPFRGETGAETLRQVISQEPVPPSRLNDKVPRDLETICLKCLHKEPSRRYATAAALAEDLHRFLRGETITARRVGRSERLLRWMRRHPAEVGLILTALALLGLAVGAGMREWALAAERRAELANWAARLEYVIRLHQEGRFPEVRAILERVPDAGSDELRRQIERARADLDLAEQLEAVRLNRAVVVGRYFDLKVNKVLADQNYAEVFRTAELGHSPDDPEDAAARVGASNIRRTLVAALDDWALCTTDQSRRKWLLEVARRADPNPTAWRDRVRDLDAWNDRAVLTELARTALVEEESVQLLVALGERLRQAGADAIPLLKRAQQQYPGDFWINFALGDALREKRQFREGVRYYQAALAVRPGSAIVYNNLGVALALNHEPDEAAEHFRRAIGIHPGFAQAHANLGNNLQLQGKRTEAIEQHRQAVGLDPGSAALQANLGVALAEAGRRGEAIAHYREALRIAPRFAGAHNNLGNALEKTGQVDEAISHFREALRIDPSDGVAHTNLASALTAKGRLDEAIDHYRQALRIDPGDTQAHTRLGMILKSRGRLDEAIVHFRRTISLDARSTQAHTNLGIALVGMGRPDEALDHFRQVLRIDPGSAGAHTNLGTALITLGRPAEAIEHLQQALCLEPNLSETYGALGTALLAVGRYRDAQAATQRFLDLLPREHHWHASGQEQLRQCEQMLTLEARLPAVLEGKDKPADAVESLQMAHICHLREQYAAAARLSADAFAAQPPLADNLRAAHRYNAACAAAVVGCGRSEEGEKPSEAERANWRRQARTWLRADLAAWRKILQSNPAAGRQVQKKLTHWRADPDLAGLREPSALDKLPPAERQECRQLWDDVDALLRRAQGLE